MNLDANKEYSVNWKNHMSHVRSALRHLLNSSELTDVTLCCEGKKIEAHKVLLSACSLYFRETFKDVPCQHPVIILYGIEYSVLSDILQFIYNGEVSVDTAKLDSFLKTAQALKISGLSEKVTEKTGGDNVADSGSSGEVAEETFAEPIATATTSLCDERKPAKRARTQEPEPVQEKTARNEGDGLFMSADVKCEPTELITFEDPLEDPLLQADQTNCGLAEAPDLGADNLKLFQLLNKVDSTSSQQEQNASSARQKEQNKSSTSSTTSRFVARHFPAILPPTRKAKPTRRCTVCHTQRRKRRESRYFCRDCNVGLCAAPCFGIYHTES